MAKRQSGFTLMEMVAVVAVIAILASIATPMIFRTIRNARVTAFAADVGVLRTAVARFYADTGRFPIHIPTDANDGRQLLLRNSVNNPVGGWNGPYIEQQLENPFTGNAYRAVLQSTAAAYQFDVDADGNNDTANPVFIRIDRVGDEDARMVSDVIDDDGDQNGWDTAGRVKRYGNAGLIIYLADG
jgi:general secretion pathway protein G